MPKTVLFASCGTFPSQLTATIWALAHESTPVIPDEVVAVGSSFGVEQVKSLLMRDGVWLEMIRDLESAGIPKETLKGRLILSPRVIRVPDDATKSEVPVDDIRTRADNERTADFLLRELCKYAFDPDTRLIVLLSGGRKTVGSLLSACMSLVGRDDDRLVHVLFANEFATPDMRPPFFFPKPGRVHVARTMVDGKLTERSLRAEDAGIELAEVPFIPLRSVFSDRQNRIPTDFMGEVRRVRRHMDRRHAKPVLTVSDAPAPGATLNGTPLKLNLYQWVVLRLLARRACAPTGTTPAARRGRAASAGNLPSSGLRVMGNKELADFLLQEEIPSLRPQRAAIERVWGAEAAKLDRPALDADRLKSILSELRALLGAAAGCDGADILPRRKCLLNTDAIEVAGEPAAQPKA